MAFGNNKKKTLKSQAKATSNVAKAKGASSLNKGKKNISSAPKSSVNTPKGKTSTKASLSKPKSAVQSGMKRISETTAKVNAKRYNQGSTAKKLTSFFTASVIGGALLAGLLMPGAIMAGNFARDSKDSFNKMPSELTSTPMGQQSEFLDSTGEPFATFFSEHREVVDYNQISPYMKNAVISIEDGRFYEHGGFDISGITRAAAANLRAGGAQQGASTLSQQYVKNMLQEDALSSDNDQAYQAAKEVSIARKLREIRFAIAVENNMTKEQVLAGYLNVAYYGAQAYGVEAAAQTYFNKTASDLSLPEAAYLAGAVQNPTRFDAFQNPEASKERRNQVLERMLHYGHITEAQYKQAIATPLKTQYVAPKQGCQYATQAPFFCSYVAATVLNSKEFGPDPDTRRRVLDRGGLKVQTTLDTRLQTAADSAAQKLTPIGDSSGVVSGLVTVQPGTGKVLAMAQSRNYDTTANPAPGSTAINYLVDQDEGGGTGFQVGSTYKTFTLVEWLKEGNHLLDLLPATQVSWPSSAWHYGCPVTGNNGTDDGWEPQNSDNVYGGTMTVQDGTVFSTNTVFTQMASRLDLCGIRDTAESMGVHRADGQPLNYSASSILGTNEIAPLTMAAAYATFAAEGKFCKPISINAATDASGKKYSVPSADCKQVITADIANGVNTALKDDARRGTATGIDAGGAKAAGKTGTTDNSAQTWVDGYTKGLSTSSWVGNPDLPNATLDGLVIGGVQYPNPVYAEHIARPNWSNYMKVAGPLYNGSDWPRPSNSIIGTASNRSDSPITEDKYPYVAD
ncbi:MAG: transglycosylase domain-containing protein [Micrococcaceae bacterium]